MPTFGLIPLLFAGVMAQGVTAPPLSEADQLRLELAKLKVEIVRLTRENVACQVERLESRVGQEVTDLFTAFEAAYPGFTFDPQRGVLVPKVKEQE